MDFQNGHGVGNIKNEICSNEEALTPYVQHIPFHTSYYEATVEFPENSIKSEVCETSCWTEETNAEGFDDGPNSEGVSTNQKLENNDCNRFVSSPGSITSSVKGESSTYEEKINQACNDNDIPNVMQNSLQCKICKYPFARRGYLKQHEISCERFHTSPTPNIGQESKYQKSMNGKQFNRYWNVVADVGGHQCMICEKTYHRYNNMKEHEKLCLKRLQLSVSKISGENKTSNEESTINDDKTKQNCMQLKDPDNLIYVPNEYPNKLKNVKQDALGRYICKICKRNYEPKNFHRHMRACERRLELVARDVNESVMGKKLSILQCPFCDKMYERELAFNQHVDECANFKELQMKRKMKAGESVEATPSCPSWEICDSIPTENKLIKVESDIQVQTTEISTDVRQSGPCLKCTNCSQRFLDIESLDSHIATAHSNDRRQPIISDSSEDEEVTKVKKLKCPFCGKLYYLKGKKFYRQHKALCKKLHCKNKDKGIKTTVEEELRRIMP